MAAAASDRKIGGTRSLGQMRMGPHMMLPGDKDAVKGVKMSRGALRRVWSFARP
jgi:hypothetical protein